MAEILVVDKTVDTNHMSSIDPKGFCAVASSPAYGVGISVGYCSLMSLRTSSSTTSTLGAKSDHCQ